mgnify:CR=1 FL=1
MPMKTSHALAFATLLSLVACSDSDDDGGGADRSPPGDGDIGAVAPLAGGTRDFRDEVLYFMLPDRFANADTANDCGFITGECDDDADGTRSKD